MAWAASDISIELDRDGTSDPVVTVSVTTPAGVLLVMAEVRIAAGTLTLSGLHLHLQEHGANQLGWVRLRWLAQAVMETLDVDELIVVGATRTTGARPGHRPGAQRFTRKSGP